MGQWREPSRQKSGMLLLAQLPPLSYNESRLEHFVKVDDARHPQPARSDTNDGSTRDSSIAERKAKT